MNKICETCGRDFDVKPSRTAARFCSYKCRGALTAENNRRRTPSGGHAARRSPEYSSWSAMLTRCYNVNAPNYFKYGGRGVSVCDRWRNSFSDFLSDMGTRPAGTSLDRIDGRGGYEPGNCRWATAIEQRHNRVVP